MASPSTMCTSCLRIARRAVAAKLIILASSSARAYSRATSGATHSLYLDFLAPSTLRRPQSPISSAIPAFASVRWRSRKSYNIIPEALRPKPAQAIQNPRTDDSGNPMVISISPRASERLQKISVGDKNPNLALRVTVESGGCHGFQYLMDLVNLSEKPATEEDTVFQGEKGEKVVIDEPSLELLNGSTVDYTMELIGSQFKITGIPGATSSCGCGTSFDIKL